MADDSAMGSLLAAVAVAAASSNPQTTSASSPPQHPNLSRSTKLAPISIPKPQTALPPPPPPLPPPLPAPPPLPPIAIRRQHQLQNPPSQSSPLPTTPASEKRKGARIFSPHEKNILEANYSRNKFPSRLHMETLANAMTKPTEKIRTWYNNRRALDRKLGLDVNRTHLYRPQPPPPLSTNSPPTLVHDNLILPTQPSPSPPSQSQQPTPITPNPRHCKPSPHTSRTHPFVDITPTSPAWPPSISPVTTPRNFQAPTSPSPQISASRFRTSPLRIRNVCLQIASQQVCGEIPDQLSLDNGLEVKFLFGKKRIVYEWYCGRDYADAQSTGGPYAKMEMNFATISAMQHIQQPPRSVLVFSFSVFPTLFLQTPESMMKYRIRAQQRQYRKVAQEEFPIPVTMAQHRISIRTDEATRVLKLLCEDAPGLPSLARAQNGINERQTFSRQDRVHLPDSAPKAAEPGPVPFGTHQSTPKVSPVVRRMPFTVYDLHPKPQRDSLKKVSVSEAREENAVDNISNAIYHQRENVGSKLQCEAPGKAIVHSSFCSPATPVFPPRTYKNTQSWPTSGESRELPKPSRANSIAHKTGTQDGVAHVRRELDFNHIPRQSASTPKAGVKRSEPETGSEESEAKLKTRRKLTKWESSFGELPISGSAQYRKDDTSNLKPEVGDRSPPKDKDDVGSNRVVSHSSILRVLPR